MADDAERELVMTLEGRQLELIIEAGREWKLARERAVAARDEALRVDEHFQALLEMATGEDPAGLEFEFDTGEVFRKDEGEVNGSG